MWLPFIYSQGYSKILVYAAIALIIIAVLFKFISHEAIGSLSPMRSPLAVKAKRSGLLLKTQKVLEAEPKLIRTLLWVFTLEGFWSMILVLIW
jgi:hypothetical protein